MNTVKSVTSKILKLFMPSAESIAGFAADRVQKSINESGKTETIAKYSTMLQDIVTKTQEINQMLVDGKIDVEEHDKIQEMLTPLFEKALALM